ncbi:MAG: hypothetical protein ACK2UL_00675 [Anaerolineae bacterium]
MDYDDYREAFLVDPPPEPRFRLTGFAGVALFYEDYEPVVDYFTDVFGPPAYVEGASTRSWRIGPGWLTILRGSDGNPRNVEVIIAAATPAEAERLQLAMIEAGGEGPEPTDQLMHAPVRYCPVRDPFGTDFLIICDLPVTS